MIGAQKLLKWWLHGRGLPRWTQLKIAEWFTVMGTPKALGQRPESPEALAETAKMPLAVKVVVSVPPLVGGACCEGIPGQWISRKPALYPVEASLSPQGREDCTTDDRGSETPQVKGSWSGGLLGGRSSAEDGRAVLKICTGIPEVARPKAARPEGPTKVKGC